MQEQKAWWQEDLSALTKAILKMDSDASSYIWSKIITEAHQRGREQGLREARGIREDMIVAARAESIPYLQRILFYFIARLDQYLSQQEGK